MQGNAGSWLSKLAITFTGRDSGDGKSVFKEKPVSLQNEARRVI
jgi:hypothetical protein